MTKRQEFRQCDVCCGIGMTPVTCIGTDDQGLRLYQVSEKAKPCSKCDGVGKRWVTVTDERDQRTHDDELDEAYEHRQFEDSQRQYR